ncbi:MAG: pyridoxine 5'-phosphate synthase [Sumerlaeia bacterium]
MIKLSVNVNKIATLRNSRGGSEPSVVRFAQLAIDAGAHGITVHPRPDQRHIRTQDVYDLKPLIAGDLEYNIEGYPDNRLLTFAEEVRPHQLTLVPDKPGVLTSNAGWDVVRNRRDLKDTIRGLKSFGCRVSLFLETDLRQVEAAAEVGADRIEFYTGPYAEEFAAGQGQAAFERYAAAARKAIEVGLGINAGHDLDLDNLPLMATLPGLAEVSIGHFITRDALLYGWDTTIKKYLAILENAESEL